MKTSVGNLHHPKYTLYDWWHVHKMKRFWPEARNLYIDVEGYEKIEKERN